MQKKSEAADYLTKLIGDRLRASDKIGETCRYIGYGIIALSFALITSDKGVVHDMYRFNRSWVLCLAALGILTVITEYLDMLLVFLGTEIEIRRVRDAREPIPGYVAVAISALSFLLFFLKQLFALAASVVLLILVAKAAM